MTYVMTTAASDRIKWKIETCARTAIALRRRDAASANLERVRYAVGSTRMERVLAYSEMADAFVSAPTVDHAVLCAYEIAALLGVALVEGSVIEILDHAVEVGERATYNV